MSRGVLLVNLGSPESTSLGDVRKYLREFLMDARVLDTAWPIRFCLVNFVMLPSRSKESAHAYEKVWTPEGSPLVVTSKHVQAKLQKRVSVPVELAMRYQNPSVESAVKNLSANGANDVLLIPLFPHYAMSSYETAVVRVQEVAAKLAPQMNITVEPPYYDRPDYIAALVASAADYLKKDYDHLLFSFHGVPERQIKKSDTTARHCLRVPSCCEVASPSHLTCYRAQCFKTMHAFVTKADVRAGRFSISFQSRLGKDAWLKPYTNTELERFGKSGVKRMLVICPTFVSDCLETIEEIGMRGRETFLRAGGEEFARIPCLNEHPLWIAALEKMIADFLG
jgi:ferrochelatase